jgi:hypothetical protein
VTPPALGIAEESLPFVILNRWIENFEIDAIFWKIWDAGASESTVIVSGRPLIGRPGGAVSRAIEEDRDSGVPIENWIRNTYHAGVPRG